METVSIPLKQEAQDVLTVEELSPDAQETAKQKTAKKKRKRKKRKKLKKVAIVGGGPTRLKAPFRKKSWDIWAFSSRRSRYPRVTRWFELHAMTDLKQQLATRKRGRRSFRNYIRFMRRLRCPVVMQKRYRGIPRSVPFPKKKVIRKFGRIFTSTASYMIALAILKGYDVIGLYGINPRGREYARQRPAIKYLLSVARRKGIKLVFPRGSRIRVPRRMRRRRVRVLYAYDWRSRHAWWRERVRRRFRRRFRTRNRIRRRRRGARIRRRVGHRRIRRVRRVRRRVRRPVRGRRRVRRRRSA